MPILIVVIFTQEWLIMIIIINNNNNDVIFFAKTLRFSWAKFLAYYIYFKCLTLHYLSRYLCLFWLQLSQFKIWVNDDNTDDNRKTKFLAWSTYFRWFFQHFSTFFSSINLFLIQTGIIRRHFLTFHQFSSVYNYLSF